MNRIVVVLVLASAAAGFALGRATAPQKRVSAPRNRIGSEERPTLPRPSLAEQHTILVGVDEPAAQMDSDGKVLLHPSGFERVLVFEDEDVDVALAAVERFGEGLRTDYVTARTSDTVTLGNIRIYWRMEGQGDDHRLRVVVAPTDPYGSERAAARTAEAIAEWCIVNGAYSRTFTSGESQMAAVTSVRVPNMEAVMPLFEAAEAEFRARGMTLAMEEVVQSAVVEIARSVDDAPTWSFYWTENQTTGTVGVYHHADPFDTAGEQELLLAVLRRALGHDVRISLSTWR
jgi:hypothetical protein